MKHNLPSLLVAAMLAGSYSGDCPAESDASAAEPSPSGAAMIAKVARQMNAAGTLQADLRQRIHLFGQRLTGTGVYRQKASPAGPRVRVEWKIPVGDQMASILQICDGRFVWTQRDLLDGVTLERIDLDRIRASDDSESYAGSHVPRTHDLAVVGLPRLLMGLSDHFEFDHPKAARLDNRPVWSVLGRWNEQKPEVTSEVLDSSPKLRAPAALAHLPTHVRIIAGQGDLMLIRIEYLRLDKTPVPPDADHSMTSARILVAIELVSPVLGRPLDDALFAFDPGKEPFSDQTEVYLQELRQRESR
jgi:hypothetical protein